MGKEKTLPRKGDLVTFLRGEPAQREVIAFVAGYIENCLIAFELPDWNVIVLGTPETAEILARHSDILGLDDRIGTIIKNLKMS